MSPGKIIPPGEQDAYECIAANRMNLFRFAGEFAESVALFTFLERGDDPPSAGVRGGVFAKRRIIAARDGALNIYHFGCSLEAITKLLPQCPTLNALIDRDAMRNSRRIFRKYFPNYRTIRHAIAHAGEMANSPSKMRQHRQRTRQTFDGGSIGPGGQLLGSVYNRTFSIGAEGTVFSVTMDQEAIGRLNTICTATEITIRAAIIALGNASPSDEN